MVEGKTSFTDLEDLDIPKMKNTFFHVYIVVRKLPLRIIRTDGKGRS